MHSQSHTALARSVIRWVCRCVFGVSRAHLPVWLSAFESWFSPGHNDFMSVSPTESAAMCHKWRCRNGLPHCPHIDCFAALWSLGRIGETRSDTETRGKHPQRRWVAQCVQVIVNELQAREGACFGRHCFWKSLQVQKRTNSCHVLAPMCSDSYTWSWWIIYEALCHHQKAPQGRSQYQEFIDEKPEPRVAMAPSYPRGGGHVRTGPQDAWGWVSHAPPFPLGLLEMPSGQLVAGTSFSVSPSVFFIISVHSALPSWDFSD